MKKITTYAPGRAELLGNHTDYNEGYVLALAVNGGITFTGEARSDRKIELRSLDFNKTECVSLDDFSADKIAPWARYTLGVVDQFRRHRLEIGGFNAEISSTLPIGAGLSSSAALENATALFLLKAFGGHLDPLAVARFGQKAEHDFVGVRCGLLDQISSLSSRKDRATLIDFRSFEIDYVPLSTGTSIIIANSQVQHSLVEGEYNARREDCETAARLLGVTALRDVSSRELEQKRSLLSDRIYRRAKHVIGENERVLTGAEALRRGDSTQFGELMFASHESSRLDFENSAPELDRLVATARVTPGVYGARLSGGGFGGATINLVAAGKEDAVVKAFTVAIPNLKCLVTPAADGALAYAAQHCS